MMHNGVKRELRKLFKELRNAKKEKCYGSLEFVYWELTGFITALTILTDMSLEQITKIRQIARNIKNDK